MEQLIIFLETLQKISTFRFNPCENGSTNI